LQKEHKKGTKRAQKQLYYKNKITIYNTVIITNKYINYNNINFNALKNRIFIAYFIAKELKEPKN